MAHTEPNRPEPTRDDVIITIAEELHRFGCINDDVYTYCTFCWSAAYDAVAKLPSEDVNSEKLDVAS